MEQPIIIQIESIYYPVLATIGIPANVLTIVILSRGRCDLSKCVTRYLVGMAAADLSLLLFAVILYEIKDYYFPYSFLNYTPICSLNLTLYLASVDWSVWCTVAFTFDRYVAICCQKLRTSYCTVKSANVVIAVIFVLSILETTPLYFIFNPREIIGNLPWSCGVKTSFHTLPIWIAYWWLEIILTPFLPFVLILPLNVLTIRHIVLANTVRRGLRGKNKGQKLDDPEMESRRKSMIILLAISGNFILLWSASFAFYVCVQFKAAEFLVTNYNDSFTILEQSGYILRTLSCCTNTFIYAVSQRKFRDELKLMIMHPLAVIIHLCKLNSSLN
ncbi:probable G-protein coupled receptor 139 [Rhincodon typus]|uniref:probable G-protein coupled receptor 139 n=1 Tax=Rhincodon typus TaxID=259920 RepID=UPI00202DC9F8|nr:probable G-protein coupled receptor 139 [Rhincodon typus]